MPDTVVLLHGFAGTKRGWDPVVEQIDRELYEPLALDLRGHGTQRDARPVDFDAVTRDVLAAAPDRFTLCGYSMGGRIALHVALAAPERVRRLLLVATTAGIDDEAAREERRAADERLAAATEDATIEAFADRWTEQALFADDPAQVRALAREDVLQNDPRALAAALRGIGTGVMPPVWDRLHELPMPVTVVAGERDAKFAAIARRLTDAIPHAELRIVPGAGHALPREAPSAIARVL
jgi:2-succinyl-6-hydroxy-2,4-cyclohexadiene-1-carboxylate synthase